LRGLFPWKTRTDVAAAVPGDKRRQQGVAELQELDKQRTLDLVAAKSLVERGAPLRAQRLKLLLSLEKFLLLRQDHGGPPCQTEHVGQYPGFAPRDPSLEAVVRRAGGELHPSHLALRGVFAKEMIL
jgi:hypothetical protein